MEKLKEIQIQQWIGHGTGILTNCYALDFDHPMHPYNQALAQNVRPEDFGIKHPLTEEYENMSRNELIDEIIHMRRQIESLAKAGFI